MSGEYDMTSAQYRRVWEINRMLSPKPRDLISLTRFFVREGPVHLYDPKERKRKKKYMFLFNDVLLICKRESHKKFLLRVHITLRTPSVSMESINNVSFNGEFRLHCRARSFMFYTGSNEQMHQWVEDIQASIDGTHALEKRDKEANERLTTLANDTRKIEQPKDLSPRDEPEEKPKRQEQQSPPSRPVQITSPRQMQQQGGGTPKQQSPRQQGGGTPRQQSPRTHHLNPSASPRETARSKSNRKLRSQTESTNSRLLIDFTNWDPMSSSPAVKTSSYPFDPYAPRHSSQPGYHQQPDNPFYSSSVPGTHYGNPAAASGVIFTSNPGYWTPNTTTPGSPGGSGLMTNNPFLTTPAQQNQYYTNNNNSFFPTATATSTTQTVNPFATNITATNTVNPFLTTITDANGLSYLSFT